METCSHPSAILAVLSAITCLGIDLAGESLGEDKLRLKDRGTTELGWFRLRASEVSVQTRGPTFPGDPGRLQRIA